jgi:hypothetical protein
VAGGQNFENSNFLGSRQISSYLPEGSRQISSYLPEGSRQITSSMFKFIQKGYIFGGLFSKRNSINQPRPSKVAIDTAYL